MNNNTIGTGLCKTINFDMSGFAGGNYAIVDFCRRMSDFLSNFKGQTNDGPFYQAFMVLPTIGIIAIALTTVFLVRPMLTGCVSQQLLPGHTTVQAQARRTFLSPPIPLLRRI